MPSARTFAPRNATDRASAEATRPIRRRPDIDWRNSLSSKVFVVGRYDFSGRTSLERARWKALCRIPGYGTRRHIGTGHHRGASGLAGEVVAAYCHRNDPIGVFCLLTLNDHIKHLYPLFHDISVIYAINSAHVNV